MYNLAKFRLKVSQYLPGYLAFVNLADTQRANGHIGFRVVDENIEEFGRMISSYAGSDGMAMRAGGDKWLAIFKRLSKLEHLIASAEKERELMVGWKATCEKKDGSVKEVKNVIRSSYVRSFRCVYTYVKSVDEVQQNAEILKANCWGFKPGLVVNLADIEQQEKVKWSCITEYPAEEPSCSFCGGNSFKWLDGDLSVYYAYGVCWQCKALVCFDHADEMIQ